MIQADDDEGGDEEQLEDGVEDDDENFTEINIPGIQLSTGESQQVNKQKELFYQFNGTNQDTEQENSNEAIFIKDDQENASEKIKKLKQQVSREQKAIKFEIYESSSDDELS